MGVTVVEKGLRCFDRSPWSIITQRRDSGRDWRLRRVSAALPLKSIATCFRDLSPMPLQTLQGLEGAGQRAAVLALRDGYQGRRAYRRVGSAPRERREEELAKLAGARWAIGLHERSGERPVVVGGRWAHGGGRAAQRAAVQPPKLRGKHSAGGRWAHGGGRAGQRAKVQPPKLRGKCSTRESGATLCGRGNTIRARTRSLAQHQRIS
jgi:hypothetical protein